jgi:hypothetical protein
MFSLVSYTLSRDRLVKGSQVNLFTKNVDVDGF